MTIYLLVDRIEYMGVYRKSKISTEIVRLSRNLFENGGMNAFSFKDLSSAIGIKTSSIHYYFPSKQDLVLALVSDYREELELSRAELEKSGDDIRIKINKFLEFYLIYFRSINNLFLDIMLVASYHSLNPVVQDEVNNLFEDNLGFLTTLLNKGRESKVLSFDEPSENIAQLILASVHGAAVISKTRGNDSTMVNVNHFIQKYLDSKSKGFISKYLSISR